MRIISNILLPLFFSFTKCEREEKKKEEEEKNIIYNTIQRYIYNDRLLPRYLFNGKRKIIRRHVFSRRIVIISTSGFQQRAPYKDDRKGGSWRGVAIIPFPLLFATKWEGGWSGGGMRKEETKRSSSDDSMFNVQCIWTNSSNQQFSYTLK